MTTILHSTTTSTGSLLILIVCVFITHTTSGVNAQLYDSCTTQNATGTTHVSCYVNKPNPLVYTAVDGTPITLGSSSRVAVQCLTSVPGTIDTCACAIAVDPVEAIEDDLCNNCTITTITDTVFENYFNCSNRLTGSCVGLTATGECISNINESPMAVPTLAPRPLPTPFPIIAPIVEAVPVLSPVTAPVILVSRDGETGTINIGIVIGIGVVAGMALSGLVAYFMMFHKRPQNGKPDPPHDVSLEPTVSREYSRSNVNHTDASTQSPAITVRNPTLATPSGGNMYQPDPRTAYLTIPEHLRSPRTTIPSQPTTPAAKPAPAVALPHTPSYPINPNLHVKDQCRVVTTPVVTAVLSPTVFVSRQPNTAALPFAVAVGVFYGIIDGIYAGIHGTQQPNKWSYAVGCLKQCNVP